MKASKKTPTEPAPRRAIDLYVLDIGGCWCSSTTMSLSYIGTSSGTKEEDEDFDFPSLAT